MPFVPHKALFPFGSSPSTSQDSQMHPFWKGVGAQLRTQELCNRSCVTARSLAAGRAAPGFGDGEERGLCPGGVTGQM